MQNDKNVNEKKMTLDELQREIERQKAIIAAMERGASAEEIEELKKAAEEKESSETEKDGENTAAEQKEPKKATVMDKIGKVAYIIFTAFLALILVVNVSMIISRNVLKNPNPTFCGLGYFVVSTASMDGEEPDSIAPGTLVFTVKNKSYEEGDIITFKGAGVSSVTHRIIEVNDDGTYVTKGDANNAPDSDPVSHNDVAGRVFATAPRMGDFVNALRSPLGLLALSCILLGIFGIPYLFGYYDEEDS